MSMSEQLFLSLQSERHRHILAVLAISPHLRDVILVLKSHGETVHVGVSRLGHVGRINKSKVEIFDLAGRHWRAHARLVADGAIVRHHELSQRDFRR